MHRATILVCPWLAYAVGEGARIFLKTVRDFSGRCTTVQRYLRDDRVVVRVDNAGAQGDAQIDPRPDTILPLRHTRHPKGTRIMYLHRRRNQPEECVDAEVLEMPADEWAQGQERLYDLHECRRPDLRAGTRHWLQLTGSGEELTADLNDFNHCVQSFASVGEYEQTRRDFCALLL